MHFKSAKHYRSVLNRCILTLLLFCYGTAFAQQAEDWIYTVRKGDNLWNLTVDYLINISYVEKVQKFNNIADPWHISPGTKIKIPSKWVKRFPAIIRVSNLQGTAQIKDDGSDRTHALNVGDMVMAGDTIITHADSTLVLDFLDGSSVLLEENSQLKIDRLMLLENTGMSESQLNLLTGRLETQVAPSTGTARKFQIKTPVTVTSVRGTDYRISAEKEKDLSKTEVVEGKVIVIANNENLALPAGFGTIAKKGQSPLPPIKLLPAVDISHISTPFGQVPVQFSLPTPKENEGYRVQIAKTDLFRDVIFDKPFYTGVIKIPGLSDGDYHLRIRAFDSLELEGFNALGHIKINAHPESPFLVSPKFGASILLEDELILSWSRQEQANRYHLQISSSEDFSELLLDAPNLTDNELTVTEKMIKGKYYWRVAATDKDGDGPFGSVQMLRRIEPAPLFELSDVTEETLTIRARSNLHGRSYHFQMAEDDSFDELMHDKQGDEASFDIARPSGGEYFIRVRTTDTDGFVGPFTKPQSIDVPYDYYWLLTLLPLLVLIAL